jgi:hypothetical protein
MKMTLLGVAAFAAQVAPAWATMPEASVLQPFSLICPGAVMGHQQLQLDVHAFPGLVRFRLGAGRGDLRQQGRGHPRRDLALVDWNVAPAARRGMDA